MVTRTRQVILAIIIVFILYAIYVNPTQAAATVQAIWNFIVSVFKQIFVFFNQLITR